MAPKLTYLRDKWLQHLATPYGLIAMAHLALAVWLADGAPLERLLEIRWRVLPLALVVPAQFVVALSFAGRGASHWSRFAPMALAYVAMLNWVILFAASEPAWRFFDSGVAIVLGWLGFAAGGVAQLTIAGEYRLPGTESVSNRRTQQRYARVDFGPSIQGQHAQGEQAGPSVRLHNVIPDVQRRNVAPAGCGMKGTPGGEAR